MPRLKKLKPEMKKAIASLVWTEKSDREVRDELGIPKTTWNRWFREVEIFREALRNEYARRDTDPSLNKRIPVVNMVGQLIERYRLYQTVPDSYIDKVVKIDVPLNAQGLPAQEGEQVVTYRENRVPVRKSNAGIKNTMLNDILDAVSGGKRLLLMGDANKPIKVEGDGITGSTDAAIAGLITSTLELISGAATEEDKGKRPGDGKSKDG